MTGFTVIMITFECIWRSEGFVAPSKYHFRIHVKSTHGIAFTIGIIAGTESKPWARILFNKGTGILDARPSVAEERGRWN